MEFKSTRGILHKTLEDALVGGLASDGGLFVPSEFPVFSVSDFDGLENFPDMARRMLVPFFEGTSLEGHLESIVNSALNFEIPVRDLGEFQILDLTKGPTNAFKDIGARFLARCLSHIEGTKTILVATSGDTGSAVASAFHNVPNTEVVILFPRGKISEIQEKQLTCWDKNILSLRVDGDFDDCQRLVKEIFKSEHNFSSANSINVGRLLPQSTYYAYSSLTYFRKFAKAPDYIIPTGNMGNALACIWAKKMGLPIGRIFMATNANRPIPDYFASHRYDPRKSIKTLANAMDVGAPSNMERFLDLIDTLDLEEYGAISVTDNQIQESIRDVREEYGEIICPHTATAYYASTQLNWEHPIIVATADPSKFKEIVEKEIGESIKFPAQLAELLSKENRVIDISASKQEVLAKYKEWVH